MIVIKINYSSVSPVVNVNYDESPIYVRVMYGGAGDSITEWGEIVGTLSNQTDLQNALNAKVPYSGATANVDLGEYELKAGQIELDQSPTGVAGVAVTRWNDTIGSTETTLKGGSVILKNGVDLVARVVNKVSPNTTLTKAAYQAVRISGAQGQRLAVAFAQANNDNNSADTIGLVTETIATNQEGFIMTVGSLEGINTTGSLQGETWSDGDVLYLSPTVAGAITNIKPVAPQHLVVIGYVEYAHQNNGKIYVKVMNGWELGELHDVNTNGATNGQVLTYNGSIWVPSTNGVGTVTSVDMTVPTGLTVSGNPITSSGTLALGLASGYSIPTDANQTNWTAAYNDKINSAAVTGTTTKTLTLNQQDGGTITASWTDYDTAPVTSVFGRTGAVVATSGDYTTDQVTEGTNLYFTDARARAAISLTTTGTSGAATYVGGVLNIPQYQAALTNPVTGTGTAGQVAYWSGTNTQTGSNNLFWDATNDRLGIGTTNPAYNLHLVTSSTSVAAFRNSAAAIGQILVGNTVSDLAIRILASGDSLIFSDTGKYLAFGSNGATERARFTSGGNLLVGTTTDGGQRLQVSGNALINNGVVFAKASGTESSNYQLSAITMGYDATNSFGWITAGGAAARTNLVLQNGGGSIGIGIVPSAWDFTTTLQVKNASIYNNNDETYITSNAYYNAGWKYIASYTATQYIAFQGQHRWYNASAGTAGGAVTFTERMRLDASGNLGLGVTPAAWASTSRALQILPYASISCQSNGAANFGFNFYEGSTNVFNYTTADEACRFSALTTGAFGWFTAPVGTIAATITFTQAMTLTNGGNLLVGTTTDSGEKLQVNGRVKSSDFASNNGTVETRLSWSSTPAGVVGTISNHPLEFYTNSSSKMTLSASGNLGIGVSPSAWGIIFKVIEGIGATSLGFRSNAIELINNAFYDGTNWIYKNNGLVNRYNVTNGQYIWYTAPSGTAGNAITFIQAMTLDASGNLGIGTTSTTKSRASILSSGGALPVLGQDVPTSNLFLTQNNTWGMYIGLESVSGKGYIQQMRNDSATSYPLLLQPVGGNLLVGVTSDIGEKLQLNGNVILTSGYKIYGNTNTGLVSSYISLYNPTDGGIDLMANFTTSKITFGTFGSERARFTAAGNLLVGTTTDGGQKLQVSGSVLFTGSVTGTGNSSTYTVTASSGFARSKYITSTLVAAANNDILVGLEISPVFNVGAFTGVSSLALRVTGASTFSSTLTALGNGTTNSAFIANNNTASGAQHYIDFTAGATVIARMLRGNGAAGLEANGLNIDNFSGLKIRLNQLGGSGGAFTVDGGVATFSSSVTAASYTVNDAGNIAVGTTTGTKIGTATSQKIGFWNATPIVQPTTAVAAAAFVANTGTAVNDASTFDGYTMAQVVKALRNAGLLA